MVSLAERTVQKGRSSTNDCSVLFYWCTLAIFWTRHSNCTIVSASVARTFAATWTHTITYTCTGIPRFDKTQAWFVYHFAQLAFRVSRFEGVCLEFTSSWLKVNVAGRSRAVVGDTVPANYTALSYLLQWVLCATTLCCVLLLTVVGEGEAPWGRKHPSNGFLLLCSSIADDIAHDTKKGSTARAPEGSNSSSSPSPLLTVLVMFFVAA